MTLRIAWADGEQGTALHLATRLRQRGVAVVCDLSPIDGGGRPSDAAVEVHDGGVRWNARDANGEGTVDAAVDALTGSAT